MQVACEPGRMSRRAAINRAHNPPLRSRAGRGAVRPRTGCGPGLTRGDPA